ncbi:unnamed protein product [Moneuplotes crassus]|uniref:USP domain-containing protein n=1 Tax=Euplotes crassus TaxID=5936 RepID=A0AAD1UC41_EUPCR|nr:unnamed protein product [Moneuplotes crassus]
MKISIKKWCHNLFRKKSSGTEKHQDEGEEGSGAGHGNIDPERCDLENGLKNGSAPEKKQEIVNKKDQSSEKESEGIRKLNKILVYSENEEDKRSKDNKSTLSLNDVAGKLNQQNEQYMNSDKNSPQQEKIPIVEKESDKKSQDNLESILNESETSGVYQTPGGPCVNSEIHESSEAKLSIQRDCPENDKKPKGMINSGNDCFFISSLQSLLCIPKFLESFTNDDSSNESINKNSIIQSLNNIVNDFQEENSSQPIDISCCRRLFDDEFEQGKQHCANQLIMALFSMIQSSSTPHKVFKSDSSKSPSEAWASYIKGRDSIIDSLFVGMYKKSFQCETCGGQTVCYEEFKNVPLPCVEGQEEQMMEVIRGVGKEEGWSEFICKNCDRTLQGCIITSLMIHFPDYLILPFQRIDTSGEKKMTKPIPFEDEFTTDEQELTYTLKSFISHIGSLNSGHYYTCCKVEEDWYCCNDRAVYYVEVEEVQKYKENAYILIYEKEQEK